MKVTFEDLEVEVIVNYKPQNRRIYLRIKNNILYISTFKKLTTSDIQTFIKQNYAFVKRNINRKPELDNHVLHLFGKPYDFKIIEECYDEVRIEDDMIMIYTKVKDYSYVKKLVDKFYISCLKDFSFNHYNDIYVRFSDVVLIKPRLEYKALKTCYGKYDKRKHTITLSAHLAKYDPFFIMLVMAHELTHCIYMNHQEDFYRLFESKFPNARRNQHILRKTKYNDYF